MQNSPFSIQNLPLLTQNSWFPSGSLQRWETPQRHAQAEKMMNYVLKMMNPALKMMNLASKMMDLALIMMIFGVLFRRARTCRRRQPARSSGSSYARWSSSPCRRGRYALRRYVPQCTTKSHRNDTNMTPKWHRNDTTQPSTAPWSPLQPLSVSLSWLVKSDFQGDFLKERGCDCKVRLGVDHVYARVSKTDEFWI